MPNPILEDIVVHDHMPSPMEAIQAHDNGIDFGVVEVLEEPSHHQHPLVVEDGDHDHDHQHHDHQGYDELVIEFDGEDAEDLSIEIPEEGDDTLPEGADVVVMQGEEPMMAIDLGDLPGAPSGTPDPEEEVEEEGDEDSSKSSSSEKSGDKNEAKDSSKDSAKKKDDRWDWKSMGFGQFTVWIKDRFQSVPKHSGYSEAGLERAKAYLERLHSEVSKAMRSDIDGELDSDIIAKIHEQIETGIEKLEERLSKVRGGKRKKRSEDSSSHIIKEGQKIFGVQSGTVITVPLFISTLARVLVNGAVSAGRDIEYSYELIVKKYKLTDREKLELIQLVQDMGFPTIRDRSLLPEEALQPESTDNLDYSANYQA